MNDQSRSSVLALLATVFVLGTGCTSFRQHGSDGGSNSGDAHDAAADLVRDDRGIGSGGGGSTGGAGNGGGGNASGGSGGSATGGNGGGASGGNGSGGASSTGGTSDTVLGGTGGGGTGGGGTGGGAPGTGGATLTCTGTQQKCGDTCVLKTSPDFCGASCMKCSAPAGGTATCDGTACDFTCGALKKCAASSLCVPTGGCCTNADCPAMAGGQAGTCDSATHQCDYSCPSGTQSCTSGTTVTCIPAGGCCKDSDCAGTCKACSASHTCAAAVNVDDPTGRCAGTCNATGVCKSKRGQLCSTVTAGCVEGTSCAPDGYCCNTACTGACQACDILGSVGTCTSVNSGGPHSNHVACGTDAACLGTCSAGLCAYAVKTCGSAASCTGNTSVGQSMCSSGACVTPAAQTCPGSLTCSGAACRTSCSGTTGCVSTSYCTGTACAAKKAAGQLCAGAVECSSNSCGGRCCSTSAACTCPQPSPGNLVRNPGFDTNLTGWTTATTAPSTISWVGSQDARGCPFSGALAINSTMDIGAESQFSQCIVLNSTAVYDIGVQWKVLPVPPGNAGIDCSASLTMNPTCTPNLGDPSVTLIMSDLYPVGWSGYDPVNQGISGSLDNANGYSRLSLNCSGRNGIAVDMIYVTAAPGAY